MGGAGNALAHDDFAQGPVPDDAVPAGASDPLELQMDALEGIIDEVQRTRADLAKGTMTDEERRKRAAETAFKLLGALGDDDSEGDSEAESEEDEDPLNLKGPKPDLELNGASPSSS